MFGVLVQIDVRVESGVRAQLVLHEGAFMGCVVIAHDMHLELGGHLVLILVRNFLNSTAW
ncbi:MAG: hypothetical protein B5766_00930 [Candidatus Lumbricidophila eiseniae]|uniref:Uncharacterized protein n=1 Tax=Candidatus Lumbricidiphila eiseniae TaxID=1969409 RepID=A0A2A6FUM2_9MICO|nr:MAG: hypothetical protein B5766_00930 [Candidatus Lumbricidophila eiseniae]